MVGAAVIEALEQLAAERPMGYTQMYQDAVMEAVEAALEEAEE